MSVVNIARNKINTGSRPGKFSYGKVENVICEVNALDLGSIIFKLMSGTSFVTLSLEKAKIAEVEYRKFLTLKCVYTEEIIVPDATVDIFWHQHILDTEKYIEDCKKIFGGTLHHFPYFGLRSHDDRLILRKEFERTVELYKERFGEPPEGAWIDRSDCG